jgi:hypothetical protein
MSIWNRGIPKISINGHVKSYSDGSMGSIDYIVDGDDIYIKHICCLRATDLVPIFASIINREGAKRVYWYGYKDILKEMTMNFKTKLIQGHSFCVYELESSILFPPINTNNLMMLGSAVLIVANVVLYWI